MGAWFLYVVTLPLCGMLWVAREVGDRYLVTVYNAQLRFAAASQGDEHPRQWDQMSSGSSQPDYSLKVAVTLKQPVEGTRALRDEVLQQSRLLEVLVRDLRDDASVARRLAEDVEEADEAAAAEEADEAEERRAQASF